MPTPRFFASASELRAWFERHAATADELHVGYYKRHTGKPSPSWSESVDEALCFGWIDGVRHSIDADRYRQRFTPRRKGSHWSNVNVAKVEALIAAGKMTPAGLAAFAARSAGKTGRTSYENRPHAFPPEHEKTFKAHKAAWTWFSGQPPGYRRTAIWYVVSAVKAETQAKRLQRLIELSAEGRRMIGPTGNAAAKPSRWSTTTGSRICPARTGRPSPAGPCSG
jgi:uncharacterized protein YdeI (YjbR/CyaY-like superfamily)